VSDRLYLAHVGDRAVLVVGHGFQRQANRLRVVFHGFGLSAQEVVSDEEAPFRFGQ